MKPCNKCGKEILTGAVVCGECAPDLVHVVRCGECKSGKINEYGKILCYLDLHIVARHDTDFCSYGERMEGQK